MYIYIYIYTYTHTIIYELYRVLNYYGRLYRIYLQNKIKNVEKLNKRALNNKRAQITSRSICESIHSIFPLSLFLSLFHSLLPPSFFYTTLLVSIVCFFLFLFSRISQAWNNEFYWILSENHRHNPPVSPTLQCMNIQCPSERYLFIYICSKYIFIYIFISFLYGRPLSLDLSLFRSLL